MARTLPLALALLVGACSDAPEQYSSVEDQPNRWPVRSQLKIKLSDIASGEVAIIVNNNAMGGSHAGLFVGTRLSDPSGSYLTDRARVKGWAGPSLRDYVDYQMDDGDKVRVYRFLLQQQDFAAIDERVRAAGRTAPLFCAATVQNQIAGIGPFNAIPDAVWVSPSGLAEQLDRLVAGGRPLGTCQQPDGSSC
jgi:hypothetical protein